MAEHSQFQLLRERRFAPFFWTQFLGAANDNVYKNALGTFVAILLGEFVGGLVIAIKPHGPVLAGATAIAVAIAGYLVSRGIPTTPVAASDLKINWNPLTETSRNLRLAYGNRVVWLSML